MPQLLPILLSVGLTMASKPSFSATTSDEQNLTVAFLYNFLKFTEWPTGTLGNEITLCVSENSGFGEELNAVSGKLAQNKSIRIRRIDLGENQQDCHLLFLSKEENPVRIREWLKNANNTPTLMVSNQSEFLDMGGMIVLVNDGNRLQFDVNLGQVNPTGLKLSAQLLKIARNVRGK